jgi:Skp family chaperone for outer membrane proteins
MLTFSVVELTMQPMKLKMLITTAVAGALLASASAQEKPADADKLIAEIRAQQAILQQNQEKIDAKIAAIAEQLRQARIFVSRGGSK